MANFIILLWEHVILTHIRPLTLGWYMMQHNKIKSIYYALWVLKQTKCAPLLDITIIIVQMHLLTSTILHLLLYIISQTWECWKEKHFQRTITHVGNGNKTYSALVTTPINSEVIVSPSIVVFQNTYEKQSYTLSINYIVGTQIVSYGSLVWVEHNVPYTVRSPIVVMLDLEKPHLADWIFVLVYFQ